MNCLRCLYFELWTVLKRFSERNNLFDYFKKIYLREKPGTYSIIGKVEGLALDGPAGMAPEHGETEPCCSASQVGATINWTHTRAVITPDATTEAQDQLLVYRWKEDNVPWTCWRSEKRASVLLFLCQPCTDAWFSCRIWLASRTRGNLRYEPPPKFRK